MYCIEMSDAFGEASGGVKQTMYTHIVLLVLVGGGGGQEPRR